LKRLVMKFGGTSLAAGENFRLVADLVSNYVNQGFEVVVVVSALKGVTDRLIEASEHAKTGDLETIYRFKREITEEHLEAARKSMHSLGNLERCRFERPVLYRRFRRDSDGLELRRGKTADECDQASS